MSGTIKHEWNGSILTVTSDSGVSSADLKGEKGDVGPRGPQGPAGVIYDEDGEVVVDLKPYATIEYVDLELDTVKVDMTAYPTKSEARSEFASKDYVSTEIAKAQLSGGAGGGDIDLSGFATKDDLKNVEVDIDNRTIIRDSYGRLKTVIGGYSNNGGIDFRLLNTEWIPWGNWNYEGWTGSDRIDTGQPWELNVEYDFSMAFKDGDVLNFKVKFKGIHALDSQTSYMVLADDCVIPFNRHFKSSGIFFYPNGVMWYDFYAVDEDFLETDDSRVPSVLRDKWILTDLTIFAPGFVPINGNYIPVDGTTVYLNDEGKLSCNSQLGEGGIDNYYTKAEIDALFAGGGVAIPYAEEVEY